MAIEKARDLIRWTVKVAQDGTVKAVEATHLQYFTENGQPMGGTGSEVPTEVPLTGELAALITQASQAVAAAVAEE